MFLLKQCNQPPTTKNNSCYILYIYIYTILQFWKLCCISISPINTQQWIKKEYCCCTEVSHLTFNFINVINLNTWKRTRRKKWILSTKLIGISNFPLTRMLRYIMKRFIADHNYIQKKSYHTVIDLSSSDSS